MSGVHVFTAADLPVPDPDDWTSHLVPPGCPGDCGNDCMSCECYSLGFANGEKADVDGIVEAALLIVSERIQQLLSEGGSVSVGWLIESVPGWTSIADDLRQIERDNNSEVVSND